MADLRPKAPNKHAKKKLKKKSIPTSNKFTNFKFYKSMFEIH